MYLGSYGEEACELYDDTAVADALYLDEGALDSIEGSTDDADSGHLLLCWDSGDVRTVQVVDVHSSAELYRWESPAKDRCTFLLAGDNRIFARKPADTAETVWTVEY